MIIKNKAFREKIAGCREMGRKWAEDGYKSVESEDEVLLNREAVYAFCKKRYGFTKAETDYFLVPYVKAMQKRFPNKYRYYRDMYIMEQEPCIREELIRNGKTFTHSEYGNTIRNIRSIIENDYEKYNKKLLKRMGFTKEEMLAEHYDSYSFNRLETDKKNTPESMRRYYCRRRDLSEKEFLLAYEAKERYYNALKARKNAYEVRNTITEEVEKLEEYKSRLEARAESDNKN